MASRLLTRASRGHNALKVHSSSRSNLSGLLCVRTLTSTTNGQQRKKPKQKKPQSGPRASEADFEQAYHNDPTYIALHKSQNPSTRVGWNFSDRHIGPRDADIQSMLKAVGPTIKSMDDFISQVIPQDIMSTFSPEYLETYPATSELSTKFHFRDIMGENDVKSPYIGGGWYTTETPTVIKRNILENPAWYTSYTPYQAEISQGRLESLLNYQTMVSDLTALPISNASLLDEGSAAAEAMAMSLNSVPAARAKRPTKVFMVSEQVHPTTLDVLRTRAEGLGITIETKDLASPTILDTLKEVGDDLVGVMVQYPDTMGSVCDFRDLADAAHEQGVLLSVGTDLSALTVLTPPGEWGADIAFGNSQRFGVPLGYGGPHAAFMAVKDSLKRRMPGRLVGVSKDRLGRRALRLALQTREQHIRREKATSNVCTSQALLANMAAMYAVYHGPSRLRDMQLENIRFARMLQEAAAFYGIECISTSLDPRGRVSSDTVVLRFGTRYQCFGVFQELTKAGILPGLGEGTLTFAINGEFSPSKLFRIVRAFKQNCQNPEQERELDVTARIWTEGQKKTNEELLGSIPQALRRKSSFLTHPVFNSHHSETELLRYIHHLQSKDLSLVHSMIPLGSCTMKLNGSTQMELIGNTRLANAHPLAKLASQPGTQTLLRQLAGSLSNITGMDKTDLHPNSGAQGEYAGLRLIRKYHKHHQSQRDICLIPVSAHGTNPASAAMAGMRVVPLKCDTVTGNLDIEDLKAKCEKHKEELGAIMITYPSTFGVFEPNIKTVCDIVHEHGGLVYMDGANMNAQIGLTSPGSLGADVCHLNLHKTFCIPHGGGGPGVGPICMKDFLFEYSKVKSLDNGTTTSAPYGSAGILPISWAYIRMLGAAGLRKATEVALLNANYILARLQDHYKILHTNSAGRCAHEFIIDARPFKETSGIEAIDIAKRLQDYGFHAPTMSWPVPNTLMIEPTESESKEELDRFIDAMISIREEIREVESGTQPREGNVLKMAPHPQYDMILGDGEGGWDRPYSRQKAAYPLPYLLQQKFWPSIARVNDTYGDTNLFCTCPPVEDTTQDPPPGSEAQPTVAQSEVVEDVAKDIAVEENVQDPASSETVR